jgi:hypothetical protein
MRYCQFGANNLSSGNTGIPCILTAVTRIDIG